MKLNNRNILFLFSILIFSIAITYIYFKGPIRGDEEEYANMAYILVEGDEKDFWHLRNYFYPLIIVLGYLPVSIFIKDPSLDNFIVISRIINVFFVIGSMFILYLILRERKNNLALFASFLFSLNWLVIYWGFRSTTQSPTMFFLFFCIYFFQKNKFSFDFLSGFALGLSFACWYGVGILIIPLILFSRSYKNILYRLLGFLAVAILFIGIMDYFTYGNFLESEREFFEFNIVEGKNSQWDNIWDSKPWYFYFTICIFTTLGPFVIFYFLSFQIIKKDDYLLNFNLISSILFLIIFTIVEHKEYRFFLPFFPLFLIPTILRLEKFNWPKKILYLIAMIYNISALFIIFVTKRLII